ncbi:DNA-3-methyladenine glycosylase [Williamsia serinedens]|uniref:Putative 3-methyladenine DNA glycosylase n=1 Tax=Williamsia serinedens TaxID=391736 RepID=A0ABT1H9B6_9NOCA|nr:DNA-3-methyladenine glycosylase [Williamsia serinedens]MCP2162398.1 DNA-3-methyladenine glycosylase [Williamsia serinedens]
MTAVRVERSRLAVDPVTAARRLLGCVIDHGPVALRIVETEAYGGPEGGRHPDPGAHSFRGPTPRAAVMFGPAGHAYVYRSYGIHLCVNITCESDGEGGAVLLRSAEVLAGHDVVADRRRSRSGVVPPQDRWAMGPGNLGAALGVGLADSGRDVLRPGSDMRLLSGETVADARVRSGPRVGLTVATGRPWRFWVDGHPAVSAWRPGSAAVRARRSASCGDAERSDW